MKLHTLIKGLRKKQGHWCACFTLLPALKFRPSGELNVEIFIKRGMFVVWSRVGFFGLVVGETDFSEVSVFIAGAGVFCFLVSALLLFRFAWLFLLSAIIEQVHLSEAPMGIVSAMFHQYRIDKTRQAS